MEKRRARIKVKRQLYVTCNDNAMQVLIRFDKITMANGLIELYTSVDLAMQNRHPFDTYLVELHIDSDKISETDMKRGIVNFKDVLYSEVYSITTLTSLNSSKEFVVNLKNLVKYDKLLQLVYRTYEEKFDDKNIPDISTVWNDDYIWLKEQFMLDNATLEELKEIWWAIDEFFKNKNKEMSERSEIDKYTREDWHRWYKFCEHNWKQAVTVKLNLKGKWRM